MGVVAEGSFDGSCLDVSSPKLLPSLLQREGRGRWTCIDLFSAEVESWAVLDPSLTLAVEDATHLSYAAESFDNVVCLSVLEHIGHGGDSAALAEMWRVLRPGGTLHLTTDVAVEPRDITVPEPIYGEASEASDAGGYLFKHDYGVLEFDKLVAANAWTVTHREYALQRNPRIEQWFYSRRPWSYAVGGLLRLVCPGNFDISTSPDVLAGQDHGVVYVVLTKETDSPVHEGVDELS
jgi:SAM-dependent methyltransferase